MRKPSRMEAEAVLRQHIKVYKNSASIQRTEGREQEAWNEEQKAAVLQCVLDVLAGKRAPLGDDGGES